jgi:hypothetical protein
MKVNRSAYYAYASRQTYRESAARVACEARVKECFWFHRRRYSTRRIAAELKIGRSTARRVMRRENLQAIQLKGFKPKTTDSDHILTVSPNLLRYGEATPINKGEIFVGDVTYLRLRNGGFCYLASLQDKYTRRLSVVKYPSE